MKKAVEIVSAILNMEKHDDIIVQDGQKFIPTTVVRQLAHTLLLELQKMEAVDNEVLALCNKAGELLKSLKGETCSIGS